MLAVTRSDCLRKMRRLVPSVARREAYVRRTVGRLCEVGYAILSGSGQRGPREMHPLGRAGSWGEALRRARLVVEGPR